MARNHRIRFAGNNFADGAAVTFTASSEMSGFAKENLQHNRRSLVTRTNGHFEVTASNKTLYINDGTDQEITLTEGSYLSPALLAAHVQTQINASSSNWTCTYLTTTNKFTIDRSSGTKKLRKSQTTNAAWSMLGYTGSSDEDAGVADEVRIHTSEWYKWDLGTAMEVTAFCLIGPKDTDFTMSTTQATATLYANSVDDWSDPPFSKSCAVTPDGIFVFLDDEDDTNYRYWLFEFEDKTNSLGPQGFKFGHAYLGDYETFTSTNIGPGWGYRLVDPSIELEAESGSLFFDQRTPYRLFDNLLIQASTATDRRSFDTFLARVGRTEPFYAFLDPLMNLTDSMAEWGGYFRFGDSTVSRAAHVVRDRMDLQIASLREVV